MKNNLTEFACLSKTSSIRHSEEREARRENPENMDWTATLPTVARSDGKRRAAFTLAETLITVIVLGIMAIILIPSLLERPLKTIDRTKVKKAMVTYEDALNKMIIENNLKSDKALTTWAKAEENCANTTKYFKKSEGDGCIFKTSDGIWWHIGNIERPLISFEDEITSSNATTIKNNAKDMTDLTAYMMVGRFDDSNILRVNDLTYETNNPKDSSDSIVKKLYRVAANDDTIGASEFEICKNEGAETCTVNGVEYEKIELEQRTLLNQCVYDRDLNEQVCGQKMESTPGTYYIKNLGSVTQADIYKYSVCEDSIYDDCLTKNDYYEIAKKKCTDNGGRLPSATELLSIAEQGKFTDRIVFASEEYSKDKAYTVDAYWKVIENGGRPKSDNRGVICIGNY